MHYIQKHILKVLTHKKWARFRDLRPENVDSNLYSYHLKQLLNDKMVDKVEGKGYRLSPAGLRYVDYISLEYFVPRWQPKVMTKIVCRDEQGRILLLPRIKQPFIDTMSLVSGKVHYEDVSVLAAAQRELAAQLSVSHKIPIHRGVVELDIFIASERVSHTLEHIFEVTLSAEDVQSASAQWREEGSLMGLVTYPGTHDILTLLAANKQFFYAQKYIQW